MSNEKERPEPIPDGDKRSKGIEDYIIEVVRRWAKSPSAIISGTRIIDCFNPTNAVLKVDRLDVDVSGRLIFRFPVTNFLPEYVIIAANEIYVSGPPTPELCATITYEYTGDRHGGIPREAARGRSWQFDWNDDDGVGGGNGTDGQSGNRGLTINLPPVFIIANRIIVSSGDPASPRLLRFDWRGVPGGNGSIGGKGGKGGNGARGTRGVNGIGYCRDRPGMGGSAGQPGKGGAGGNAGRGGNGADVYVIVPRSQANNIRFGVLQTGAAPGTPGKGGPHGDVGIPGGGGSLSEFCREGNVDGNQPGPPNPANLGDGLDAPMGTDGQYFVQYRDNSDLFI
jgi:hypothetical protein